MLRTHTFSREWLISLCWVLLFSGLALGQITNVTNDQSTPIPGAGHDYIKLFNETVNPANGSVSIRIGVPVPPGRRLTLPFAFAYDSNGVHHPESWGSTGNVFWTSDTTFLSQGGWAYTVPLLSMVTESWPFTSGDYNVSCAFLTDYVFTDPNGGRHALGLSVWQPGSVSMCKQDPGAPQVVTQGGDDIYQALAADTRTWTQGNPPVMIADADGTVYHFPTDPGSEEASGGFAELPDFIEDRNGNQITFKDLGSGAFTETDTLGRTAISSSGFGATGNTVTVSGLASSYLVGWGTASSSYSAGPKLLSGDSGCQFGSESGSTPVIIYIELPNGQSYSLAYESTYGLLNQITYPSGAWVKYTWGLNSQSEFGAFTDQYGNQQACTYTYGAPAVAQRQVSFDGTHVALTQAFSYTTTWGSVGGAMAWTQKTTTVTTTDNVRNTSFSTVYTYGPVTVQLPPNETSHFAQQVPVETQIVYKDWGGNTLSTVTKTWKDQYLMTQQRTQPYGGGTAEKDYAYSAFDGNTFPIYLLTDEKDYDYASNPPGNLLKETSISYWTPSNSPIFGLSGTFYKTIFDRPSEVLTCNASPCSSSQNRLAETDYSYDGNSLTQTSSVENHDYTNYGSSYNNRGNAISKSEWVNTSGSSLVWDYTYDDTGQALSMTDPAAHTTSYSYNDDFTACGSPSGSTNAYLTKITDAKAFTQTFAYRYCDGQLASATDRNSQTTTYAYADSLNRLTSINYPDGGQTTYGYSGICGQPSSTTILLSSTPTYYTETATLDGVCHVTQTALTSDPQGTDYTATTYDGSGRVWKVSNPYRSTSESSYGLTTTTYDALGRVSDEGSTKSIVFPDGSATSTTYSGQCSTVIDPENHARTLCDDALGRLVSVAEDPSGLNYSTSYAYNALDDLLTVTQGSQTRTFAYDSLKRLVSATNPESGTTSYTYPTSNSGPCSGDPSDACTRTDARSITTTYAYSDPLNRLTGKTYSDGTPTANLAYDESSVTLGSWTSPALAYPKGRLTHTTTMSGSTLLTATVQDYDKLGRPQHYWQCTPLNCGTASIWAALDNYDLAGDVTWWNHPGGFTVNQPVDNARHIEQVTSTLSDAQHPATLASAACLPNSTSICYTAWGAVSSLQNACVGSGCTSVQETYAYNNRLQMALAELGTSGTHALDSCREYSYYVGVAASGCSETPSNWPTGTNNNGNVAGYLFQDSMNALGHTATYTYDGVNRLSTAAATGSVAYNQTYTYTGDGSTGQYGNLNCSPSGPGCVALTYNTASNRITSSGYAYDAAGNLTGDGTNTYQWDAEAHLTKVVNGAGTAISTNTYNALGQRVRDVTQTSTTDEAYGAGGELLWRYTGSATDPNQRAFVPFAGGILAEYYGGSPGGTLFDHPDELGSLTASTSYNGGACQERLFYPFGELWTGAGNCGMHQTFGKLPDYDAETDQYNTLNRHYSPSGRWLSPDPAGKGAVHLDDPQTWNLYAYVRNNPTTLTDPTGLDFNLTCKQTKDNASTCQGGLVGTTNDKGKFTATVITSASLQDPKSGVTGTVTEGGVKITTASGTYTGQFINGTPAATLQGSGAFAPFTFNITGQSSGNLLRGSWQFNGTAAQAASWMFSHGAWSYPGLDLFNPFHPNTQQYRFSDPNNPAGPSMHLSQPLGVTMGIGAYGIDLQNYPSAAGGPFHVDEHGTLWGHIEDVWDVLTQ
jgi:RHS repeat-associated protein